MNRFVRNEEAATRYLKLGNRSSKRRRNLFVYIGGATICLIIAGGLSAGWLAYRGNQIQSSLEKSVSLIPSLRVQLVNGEKSAAHSTLEDLKEQTGIARSAATDPVWRAAAGLPGVGANFSVVGEVAVTADDLVNRAAAPLIEEFAIFDWNNLTPVNGSVDIGPVRAAAPSLASAAHTVGLSHKRLSSIDAEPLLPGVAEPLAQATEALGEASTLLDTASSAAKILPSILGADSPRNYLVLIQNSAELRATGGIPGALAVITASDGRLELVDQSTAVELGRFDPAIEVDEEQSAIYSNRMGRFMQSVNLTPDFPTVAETATKMWETRNRETPVDGVIAIDPVALSHILEATGPVQLAFEDSGVEAVLLDAGLPQSLTADNIIPTLLSDVYKKIETPDLQDAYFAAVAAEVFAALSSGTDNPSGLIQALSSSTSEGRLYLWSADPEEQRVIRSTDLAGSVSGPESGGASFGAYFNDGTGAKMDYYVRRTVQLNLSCTQKGYRNYTLSATLTNTAPLDAATSLPEYVTGGGIFGTPPGTVQSNFIAYGPDQARLQTARIDGEPVPLGSHRHGKRPVGLVTTQLQPGQSVTVEIDFSNVIQQTEPVLDVTPTLQAVEEVILAPSGATSCP